MQLPRAGALVAVTDTANELRIPSSSRQGESQTVVVDYIMVVLFVATDGVHHLPLTFVYYYYFTLAEVDILWKFKSDLGAPLYRYDQCKVEPW